MSEFGKNLRAIRISRGLSQEELASLLGTSKQVISRYETGQRSPKISVASEYAQKLNVSLHVLNGEVERSSQLDTLDKSSSSHMEEIYPNNLYRIEKRRFPMLGEIACGQPILAAEEKELYVEAGADIRADFCLRAKGDSMIGARIHDGDIVFIQQQEVVNDGEIAAVIIDDEATLKRVSYHPDKNLLILKAENPRYADMVFVGEELDHIHILGRAVAFQSDVL